MHNLVGSAGRTYKSSYRIWQSTGTEALSEVRAVNVLLVSAEDRLSALPLDSVVEVVRLSRSDVKTVKSREAITVRGRILPLIWLADVLATGAVQQKRLGDLSLEEVTERGRPILEKAMRDVRVVSMDEKALTFALEELLEAHVFLEMAYVTDRNGRMLAGFVREKGAVVPVEVEAANQDWSSRAWFREAAAGKMYVSEKYVSLITGSLCVTVSAPVRDPSGAVLGVMAIDVSTQVMKDRLYIVVIDEDSRQIGLVVSEIIGKRDVEVEPLPPALPGLDLLGTAVMDDGAIAVVIDTGHLVRGIS